MSQAARNAAELYSRLENKALDKGARLKKEETLAEMESFFAQILVTIEQEVAANARFLNKGGRYPSQDEWANIAARKFPLWPDFHARQSWLRLTESGWTLGTGKSKIVDWGATMEKNFNYWVSDPENAEALREQKAKLGRQEKQPEADVEPQGWAAWVKENLPENWRGFRMDRWPLWSELLPDEKNAIRSQMK